MNVGDHFDVHLCTLGTNCTLYSGNEADTHEFAFCGVFAGSTAYHFTWLEHVWLLAKINISKGNIWVYSSRATVISPIYHEPEYTATLMH